MPSPTPPSHPLLPEYELFLDQHVEFGSRKGKEIEHLVDAAQKLVSSEVALAEGGGGGAKKGR